MSKKELQTEVTHTDEMQKAIYKGPGLKRQRDGRTPEPLFSRIMGAGEWRGEVTWNSPEP